MSDVRYELNGKTHLVKPCPRCCDESLVFDAGMMAGSVGCFACGFRVIQSDIFEAIELWNKTKLDDVLTDNKSQSIDHDLQSFDDVTTSSDDDCTLPPVWANIVFDLETAEGERRLRECLDAPKVKLVLWEFDEYLRGRIRYDGFTKEIEAAPLDRVQHSVDIFVAEVIREQLYRLCDDYGIRLDEE